MIKMTVTEFARNLKNVFDRVEHKGEEVVLLRNNHQIARITPGSTYQTALEAMSDLYRTLPEDAAKDWLQESRSGNTLDKDIRDPWES
jgi:antitoxin (DNA-binding transcriptional repressor) of toxin-antitoxin stability system